MAEQRFEQGLRGLDTGPGATPGDAADGFAPANDVPEHASVRALRERFPGAVQHHVVMSGDEHVVYVPAAQVSEVLAWLKADPSQAYDFLADLTAVDYGGGRPLEVVYQLWSISHKRALRVKALLPLNALEVDSVEPLWKAANWLEREVFDLFGIHFRGHPDLRRILMPETYAEGHPLRKDFPLRGRFSRAEQTHRALSMTVEDHYIPEELRLAATLDAAPQGSGTEERITPHELDEVGREVAAEAADIRRPKRADRWSLGTQDAGAEGAPGPQGGGS